MFILGLLWIFVAIFGTAFWVAYNYSYRGAIKSAIASNEMTANLVAHMIFEHQRGVTGVIRSYKRRFSLIEGVKKKDIKKVLRHLRELKEEKDTGIDEAFITDRDGLLWANFPVRAATHGKNFSEVEWYQGESKGWKPYVSGLFRREPTGDLVVVICAPILDQKDNVIGILGIFQKTAFLCGVIDEIGVQTHARITVTDQEGHIICSNGFKELSFEKELIRHPILSSVKEFLEKGRKPIQIKDPESKDVRYIAFAPVGEMGWLTIIDQDRNGVLKSVSPFLVQQGIIALLTFLLATIFLIYFRRVIWLQAVNRELEAFASSASHDLRAPLLGIKGLSDLLHKKYSHLLDGKGQQFLSVIQKDSQHMLCLIEDLFAFSRFEVQEINQSNIDMERVARAVFDEIKGLIPSHNVALSIKTLPAAYGDEVMVQHVFSNLFSNAIKFTKLKDNASIEIGARVGRSQNLYYVRDNGVGFDMRYADKLFRPFQRLHNRDEFEGTGVGLATVLRIIQRHSGRLWAEGKLNEGATFYFTLPKARPKTPKKPMSTAGKERRGLKQEMSERDFPK
ncbi:MAG: hypothetical protein A2156_15005 [Deltaproteobacteria bacterium RBG_16_48_10]|nr:MAG: hypothetical protein A2156_15005 [Deltaproteobacteria bacterium RBG_16_48_10]